MNAPSLAAWNQPLTAPEREELLDAVAARVHKWRLETPAIFALETHRPLAFVASQGLIGLTPMVGPLMNLLLGLDPERVQRLSRLLAEPNGVDALIARLEEAR
jgi:hypothetical protein